LENGGEIFYSDTDSLVTSIPLPDELMGFDLGKFKLEYKIKRAFFITSKTYYIETDEGEEIIKSKGVLSKSLTVKDFEDMYYHSKNSVGQKKFSTKDYSSGTVNIKTKSINIDSDVYKKREKIYNSNGL